MAWEDPIEVAVPEGCNPCRWCGKRCMYAEQLEHDWEGRGRVVRIGSDCDESNAGMAGMEWENLRRVRRIRDDPDIKALGPAVVEPQFPDEVAGQMPAMLSDKDLVRTSFAPEAQAVAEWNRMNP